MRQIELLYINKSNNKRLQEWYSLLNVKSELNEEQKNRLAVLDQEFQCKALLFSDKPQGEIVEKEAIRNEIIMAFGYIVNKNVISFEDKLYMDRRFKYLKDIENDAKIKTQE